MSSNEPLRLEKYGITANRYRELHYFCLRWHEYKQGSWQAEMIRGALSDIIEENYRGVRKFDLFFCLLESVTRKGYSYNYAYMRENIPCSKGEYQKLRRLFFVELDKKRDEKIKKAVKNERVCKKIL